MKQFIVMCRHALLCALLWLGLAPAAFAQQGTTIPDSLRGSQKWIAKGYMDGNLIEASFRNYAEFANNNDRPAGVYPKGSSNEHIDNLGMAVSAQVIGRRTGPYAQFYPGRGDTVLNPVIIHNFDGRKVGPDGTIWGWLPLPYFHNPNRFNAQEQRDPTPALSDDPESWPRLWPDKLNVAEDPGWEGNEFDNDPSVAAWNGFFGKNVFNADLETFYVMDDLSAYDYAVDPQTGRPYSPYGVFYADPADPTKGGLGLQVAVRAFQWGNVLAEDAMFVLYRLTNIGQTSYGTAPLGMPCYTFNDAGETWIDPVCRDAGLHLTQFSDYGMGLEENDESTRYNPQLDVAYGWDNDHTGMRPNGGSYPIAYTGYAFLESPVRRSDGKDNDEDGITDEDRFSGPGILIEGQAAIRAAVEGRYDMMDFERQDSLQSRRAFQAGRWWTGDEDVDWVGYWDQNENGQWDSGELLNDDVGADGLGPFDLAYTDPDDGEADGIPTAGEPNFDDTDIEEGDQVGLTGIHLANRTQYTDGDPKPMTLDEFMWQRIIESQFPLGTQPPDALPNNEPWITWNSGPIALSPGQTDFFSTAWIFGDNEQDFLDNRSVVQTIYNADYRFAQPPIPPRLSAQAGDGFVVLTWDTLSLGSYDRFTQELDFEGYKLYRGTDPLLSDARLITDFRGTPTFYKPIAQWDLDNSVDGLQPVLRGTAVWDLGQNTGLEFAYIDRDVTNGVTYYYAIVAYDRGYEPPPNPQTGQRLEAIDPQFNTFNITVDLAGSVKSKSQNVAVVTPRADAAGFEGAATNEALSEPHGSHVPGRTDPLGTGSIEVTVYDETLVPEDAVFEISFFDQNVQNTDFYETTAYTVKNLTTNDTLVSRQAYSGLRTSTSGIIIGFDNDELALDLGRSGWAALDGTGQPVYSPNPAVLEGYATNWLVDISADSLPGFRRTSDEFQIRFTPPDSARYTPPRFSSAYPRTPIPVRCVNLTDDRNCDLLIDDVDDDGQFNAGDHLLIMDKRPGCNTCLLEGRFRLAFTLPEGAAESRFPEAGAIVRVSQKRPFGGGDYFRFTIRPSAVNADSARSELDRIRVVPNPYVMAAEWEPKTQIQGRGPRLIRFTRLPQECTIRIFTIRGELVQTIEHDGAFGDGSASWDLKTSDNQDIAYGVYLYHIEAPGIGETTGKFAIVK